MNILGIETSCDETAAAIVVDGTKILSNIVATSVEMHAKTGGIIPEDAARQQVKSIIPVIQEALDSAGLTETDIDAIAVTVGPGLIGSLLVGVETAKTLSSLWNKPIIAVNHLVGHLYANWLSTDDLPQFPAVGMVVSGGHTDLVIMHNHGKIEWVGGTRDDAAGEAFDKTARLLRLGYPGGPAISKAAEKYIQTKGKNLKLTLFPRPLFDQDSLDLSFSGLKTAVLRETQKENSSLQERTEELSAEVQEAIVDVLVSKAIKAIVKYKPKSFLLAGGVAANKRLNEKMKSELDPNKYRVNFYVPGIKLCTDNAAYIASLAFYNYIPTKWENITAYPDLTIAE